MPGGDEGSRGKPGGGQNRRRWGSSLLDRRSAKACPTSGPQSPTLLGYPVDISHFSSPLLIYPKPIPSAIFPLCQWQLSFPSCSSYKADIIGLAFKTPVQFRQKACCFYLPEALNLTPSFHLFHCYFGPSRHHHSLGFCPCSLPGLCSVLAPSRVNRLTWHLAALSQSRPSGSPHLTGTESVGAHRLLPSGLISYFSSLLTLSTRGSSLLCCNHTEHTLALRALFW